MRPGCTIALLCLLTSCELGPDYHKPSSLSGEGPVPALANGREIAFDALAPLPPRWWQLYDDPVLDGLEEKALTRNTDLRIALASLEQAQAALGEVQAERLPLTSLTVDPEYRQASGDADGYTHALRPGSVYVGMANISYDLDLFGRLRRLVEVSRADVGAAQAALDLSRVNVAGETAAAYVSVCSAGLEIAVTQRSIVLAQQTLNVTQRRYDAGIEGINDVVRERTLLWQTEATLPSLVTQQRSALFTLVTMTGDPPEQLPTAVVGCTTPPLIRSPIPIGNGAALLARRPDVREAERKLAAAVAGIGVSTAALYPSITIGGGIGIEATALSHVTEDRAFVWNVGPLITWNFPNISVARAEIAESNAGAVEALATFDGTVLTALRETETALVTLAEQLDMERQLTAARDEAAVASDNTEKLYQGGIGEFLDVLDAEQTLISADAASAQATAQVAQDQVSLFMALGGGWQNAPAVVRTALQPVTVAHER